jgi:hypothetical protein
MSQVDGRGKSLLDVDDPDLPSLLAMPLLGFDEYDTDTEVITALELDKVASHPHGVCKCAYGTILSNCTRVCA